ncbi:MAG: DUF3108 domain-containing protein [Flavobacteriales bacterium]|nr:DUF3108 domain-containing protein [Flavobacteriales bacterium]
MSNRVALNKKKVYLAVCAVLLCSFSFAQQHCSITDIPFEGGEKITYDIYYNWHFVWTHAGEVYFKADSTTFYKKKVFHFYSYGTTYKKYDWIFKVRDTYQSYADFYSLKPYWFKRVVNEGSDYLFNEYWFNYYNGKAYTFSKKNKLPLQKDSSSFTPCTFDVLTMVYYARTIDFEKCKHNDTIPIKLFIEEKEYQTYIRYLGKEEIKTRSKEVYLCYKFKPLLIEGTLFKGGEGMTVWVTADKNKIPVLIESEILVGSIKAYLKHTEGLKYQMAR